MTDPIIPQDTLKDKTLGAITWGAGLLWGVPMMSALTLAYRTLGVRRADPLSRFYIWGQMQCTGAKWKCVVHPDIDPDGVYMFAQNHTNHFDYLAMYRATPHVKQGIELEKHFKYPIYGPMMKARGTIPVKPFDRSNRELMLEKMRQEVAMGNSLLVFPEGTRTLTGELGRFRLGVFNMAHKLKVPIVPVAVTGMFEMMRKGSWVIRPGRQITVYCEKPIETSSFDSGEIPALAKQVRNAIEARLQSY